MSNRIYRNNYNLGGKNGPSWENISDEVWKIILSDFFYMTADSFGFSSVLERKDLFPTGLEFFENWQLEEASISEIKSNLSCKFKLNDTCKLKLLEKDFSIHQKGNPGNFKFHDELNYYYEFDELYFFSGNRLIGVFVNHENFIEFKDLVEDEIKLLNQLDKTITKDIIDN